MTENAVFLGKSQNPEFLNLKYANRHGLIAGATGTGKTVTLQIIAEGLSKTAARTLARELVRGILGSLKRR
jgi:DNA double-strand break repair helicase HerA and related ATPase